MTKERRQRARQGKQGKQGKLGKQGKQGENILKIYLTRSKQGTLTVIEAREKLVHIALNRRLSFNT